MVWPLCAQTPPLPPPQPAPQPDPTTALLLSQPQIDTTSPVTAIAAFDPPVIRPGGTSTYRVTFNAMMDSIQWPEDVIAPRQLEMEPGGRGQMFMPAGTNLQPRTTFNTRVQATAEGTFTVPRYMVYVYGRPVTVPETQLQVIADPAIPVRSGPVVRLEFSTTNAFVGQPLNARVVMSGESNGIVQALTLIKLLGEGFLSDPTSARQRVEMMNPSANSLPAFIYEIDVTPIVPGQIKISAQGFTAGNQFAGPITITGRVTIPGGPPQYQLLDAPPVTLNVRPLPPEGRLPGFSGAIGQFNLDSPALGTNMLHVGDPVSFSVRVLGKGNLARLAPPPPPQLPGWKVFAGKPDPGPPQLITARGFIVFNYTLIPTTEKTNATPVIPFSYFDPEKMAYVDLSLPSLPVTVKPSTVPVNLEALAEAEAAGREREPEPRLSDLATTPGRTLASLTPWQQRRWFPAVQFAPALAFAGLWWWDRRRRFFEAHPEILLRRRARRALHREWAALRQAASLGDTSRFAACAVNAMRVACAPHYPAEPRALVSTDVLPLLPESDAAIQLAVRQVFATANADRFATAPENTSNLLSLRADVDRVLEQLEGKLQ